MDLLELADRYEPYMIDQRRFFHRYPEAAWEEVQTTLAIEYQLRNMGLEPVRFEDISGVYAEIRGKKTPERGCTLLLRADIDGVLLQEETGLSFSSVKRGLMHATGRDCHIAMMLGAARMLLGLADEFSGTVRVLFQAAEESAQGSKECIARGILKGVDAAYAARVYGRLEAPMIDASPGYRLASADKFTIEVFGQAASAGQPHLGRDAIVAAADMIGEIQTYVSRRNNPTSPLAITIGQISGGTQRNLISDYAKMEGTVRAQSVETREKIKADLTALAEHTAAMHGCRTQFQYQYMLPPLENDEELSAIVMGAAERLFGKHVLAHFPPLMSSEDFSNYGEHVPCVYVNLGCANRQLGYTENNYSSRFMVDESVLKRGAALCVQFALDYFNQ